MKSDEKACPYCAETIKAAAIKCRYCQSDLSAPAPEAPPAPGPEKEPEEPAEAGHPATAYEPGVEEQLPVAEGDTKQPTGFLASPYLTALLGVLLVAVVLGIVLVQRIGGDDGTAPDGQVVDSRVRAVALSQASDLVQGALSYSYKDFDKVRRTNTAKMGPGFRKQYAAAMGKAEKNTKSYRVTLRTTVVASGLQSITAHRARVLLFVNQATSAESGPDKKATTQLNRTVVTLSRGDGDWRIDGIDPLAGG